MDQQLTIKGWKLKSYHRGENQFWCQSIHWHQNLIQLPFRKNAYTCPLSKSLTAWLFSYSLSSSSREESVEGVERHPADPVVFLEQHLHRPSPAAAEDQPRATGHVGRGEGGSVLGGRWPRNGDRRPVHQQPWKVRHGQAVCRQGGCFWRYVASRNLDAPCFFLPFFPFTLA